MVGRTSPKSKTRIAKGADGNICSPSEGGKFDSRKPQTSIKFPGEARGCFGVAMKRTPTGEMIGVKCRPFQYTNRWVVGVKKYYELCIAEYHRLDKLKRRIALNQQIIKQSVNKKYCCITELMDHVVEESKRVYEGTVHENTFFIYHDALSQWWEKESQDHMAELGFANRQIRCIGETNAHTRYRNKLVGDSPELCRGLDSFGFADLKASTIYHMSLSSVYKMDDPRRFLMGTPQQAWRTLERCWEVEPTSARIVEDISGFERVLDKIIENNGAVVEVTETFH
jgi:hypothetical protein